MPKDKKAKAAAKKLRVAQKTEKKVAQKEKKATKKPKGGAGDASSDEDDSTDLDAILASYAAQQEKFLKVTEAVLDAPPSPRSASTFLASPSNENELLLFGGEYYDGSLARFYNDLCIYNINRDEWRLVTSPNSPLPRSGHAWCRGGNAGGVYLFGGEFSSPKQGTFYHYNDFWKLDPSTREWSKIESKGKSAGSSPHARSGHRITYFKNYIVLFGGFQDTAHQTKYLNDLWVYDCQNFAWHSPVLPPASAKPDPRSSFTLLPHESGAVLFGGYSRVKVATMTRPTKGGRGVPHDVMKPVVHQDTWFLRITPPAAEAPSNTPPTVRWERRKRPANAPNPPRAGASMTFHRGRGIQFGGVHDIEQSEEGIDSEFFNTLYVWNVDRNRFFPLSLRRPRVGKKAVAVSERNRRGRGKADKEDLLKNLATLEMQHAGGQIAGNEEEKDTADGEQHDEEEDLKVEKPVYWDLPHPRFNAQLTVTQNDVLYVFGGTFEKGDQEYTLDEMHAIDLGKLDGVREIFKRELQDWHGSEDEESEDEDEDDEEEDDDEDEDNDADSIGEKVDSTPTTKDSSQKEAGTSTSGEIAEKYSAIDNRSVEDVNSKELVAHESDKKTQEDEQFPLPPDNDKTPQPRPFETLRDFYTRTSEQWQEILLEERSTSSGGPNRSIKEVRKEAFELAEEKWWDSREYIQALEEEQEEAGIGEVVNLTDKAANQTGGTGRRR